MHGVKQWNFNYSISLLCFPQFTVWLGLRTLLDNSFISLSEVHHSEVHNNSLSSLLPACIKGAVCFGGRERRRTIMSVWDERVVLNQWPLALSSHKKGLFAEVRQRLYRPQGNHCEPCLCMIVCFKSIASGSSSKCVCLCECVCL